MRSATAAGSQVTDQFIERCEDARLAVRSLDGRGWDLRPPASRSRRRGVPRHPRAPLERSSLLPKRRRRRCFLAWMRRWAPREEPTPTTPTRHGPESWSASAIARAAGMPAISVSAFSVAKLAAPLEIEAFPARHRGFEPLTYGSGVSRPRLGGASRGSQVGGTVHCWTSLAIQGSHPLAEFSRPLVTPLLQGPAGLRVVYRQRDRALFSVRQVAERLGVSTATVYGLVTRGEVPHVRVANAIRVAPSDLATFVNTKTR